MSYKIGALQPSKTAVKLITYPFGTYIALTQRVGHHGKKMRHPSRLFITLTIIVVLSWVAVAQATIQLQLSEPSAMLLVGIGLVGLGILGKKAAPEVNQPRKRGLKYPSELVNRTLDTHLERLGGHSDSRETSIQFSD